MRSKIITTPSVPNGISSQSRKLPKLDGIDLVIESAEGSKVWDDSGRAYVDYIGAMGAVAFGHNHPHIRDALRGAAAHTIAHGMQHTGEIEAGEALLNLAPSMDWVDFTNSGTEATSLATALARLKTGRGTIAKFGGGFHGWIGGLRFGQAGSDAALYGTETRPESEGFVLMRYNDREDVDALFDGNDDIAAVIMEPILANAGCIEPAPGFMQHVAERAHENGALVIIDNILAGLHTPGPFLDLCGVDADMTTVGKSVGGGVGMGALLAKDNLRSLVETPGKFVTAGTFAGSPWVAAGVKAVDSLPNSLQLREEAIRMTDELRRGLVAVLHEAGRPASTSGSGTVFSLWHAEKPPLTYAEAVAMGSASINESIHAAMRRRGFLIMASKFGRYFVSTAHTRNDVTATIAAFRDAVVNGEIHSASRIAT
ncbi:UNVERIFIED_ORG: glutamate-1-semialdehyde 2,1-aminomutase [Arthrobacter sp. UYCu721]